STWDRRSRFGVGLLSPVERGKPTRNHRAALAVRARSVSEGSGQDPSLTLRARTGWRVQVHLRVHRVQAELLPILDDDAAGLILRHGLQRVARVLLPVDQVGGRGDGSAPQSGAGPCLGAAVVVGVIT